MSQRSEVRQKQCQCSSEVKVPPHSHQGVCFSAHQFVPCPCLRWSKPWSWSSTDSGWTFGILPSPRTHQVGSPPLAWGGCGLVCLRPSDGACLSPAGAAAPAPWWLRPAAALLREALLLLHWLLLHHRSFSESCRPLLHMYDQVVPAVQDVLRRVPGRSESEGEHVHTQPLPRLLPQPCILSSVPLLN